jgi:hypothetical protein
MMLMIGFVEDRVLVVAVVVQQQTIITDMWRFMIKPF